MHVLLVDDHALFRSGLRCLMSELDEGLTFAEAGRLADALTHREAAVDLVVVDTALPDRGGADAIARLRAAFPSADVVVVSADEDPARARAALDGGARAVVRKNGPPGQLVAALRPLLAAASHRTPEL